MMNLWHKTLEQFQNYIGNGLVMGLFAAALIFLFFQEKDKTRRVLLLYFPAAVMFLFFCPLFSGMIYMALDDETYYRILWLLPQTVVLGYAGIRLVTLFRKRLLQAVTAVLLCAVIIGSGSYVYHNPYFSKAQNRFHVPQTVADVCDAIIIPGREVRATMPDEMLPYVRQYTANVCMPYGRDVVVKSWEKKSKLHDAMSASEIDCQKVAELSKEKECQYIVLHSSWKKVGSLENYGYQHVKDVDGYEIYLLDGADLSVP